MNIIGSPRRVVMFFTAPMSPPTVTVSLSARSASAATPQVTARASCWRQSWSGWLDT